GPPPSSGGWDFRTADHIRDFAAAYGMRTRMGFFMWHATTPPWVADLSPDDTRTALADQINTVMARYRGQVAVWDVANEMLAPDPPPSSGFPECSSAAAAATGHPRS